jgi:hypothetical protein
MSAGELNGVAEDAGGDVNTEFGATLNPVGLMAVPFGLEATSDSNGKGVNSGFLAPFTATWFKP